MVAFEMKSTPGFIFQKSDRKHHKAQIDHHLIYELNRFAKLPTFSVKTEEKTIPFKSFP